MRSSKGSKSEIEFRTYKMRPFDANTSDIDLNDSAITIQRVPRSCEWCHEVFNELTQLEAHQILCIQNKTFECSSCSEKFPTPRRLDKHMKFSHSPLNPRGNYFYLLKRIGMFKLTAFYT